MESLPKKFISLYWRQVNESQIQLSLRGWLGTRVARVGQLRIGYQPGVANILVLGRDGVIHARFTGEANETAVAKARAALEKVLATPP